MARILIAWELGEALGHLARVPLALPVLSRPRHVEQALFARRIAALGAGRVLDGRLAPERVPGVVLAMLERSDERAAARAFAARHRGFSPDRAVGLTVAAIERCIGFVPPRSPRMNLVPET